MEIIGPEEALRHLEMAETSRMYEEAQIDRRQAERENMRMSDPSLILPQVFQGMFDNLLAQVEGPAGALPPGPVTGPPVPPGPPDVMPNGTMAPPSAPMDMPVNGGMPQSGDAGALGGMVAPSPQMQPTSPEMPVPPEPAPGGMGEGLGGPAISPMAAGLPMPPPPPIVKVNTWDNHEVHIQVHNDYRKRQEFESLPDALKEEFERHVALHRAAMGLPPEINPEQMQQIMAVQQAMPQPLDVGVNPQNEPGPPALGGASAQQPPQPNGTAPL